MTELQTKERPRLLVVCPSYSAVQTESFAPTARSLEAVGFTVIIGCNSSGALAKANCLRLRHRDLGENLGFGKAVNNVFDWDTELHGEEPNWVLICNDDISIDLEQAHEIRKVLLSTDGEPGVVFFGEESPRRIPGPLGVFLLVSMISDVHRRLLRIASAGRARLCDEPAGLYTISPGYYQSFSCVALAGSSFRSLGGFSDELPLYFEDSDYMRRFWDLGGRTALGMKMSVEHGHSATTSSYIRSVLPVLALSATRYLGRSGGSRAAGRVIVASALLLRAVIQLARAAPAYSEHFIGSLSGLAVVVTGASPALPPYSCRSEVRKVRRNQGMP